MFLIKRTGSGRDTKYDVSPKRKVYKGDILKNCGRPSMTHANQADETRLLSTVRTMGRLIGIAAPAAATAAISSPAAASAATLPVLAPSLAIRKVQPL